MKYAVFYKTLDELNGDDFDKEVVNQYENLTLTDAGLSCTVNGQEVITTIDNITQDMCEKQVELIFDAFAERIAKKMHEVLQREPKCGKWVDVSERGSWSIKNACDQCGEIVFQPNYNYCPNCGAKMEVEE